MEQGKNRGHGREEERRQGIDGDKSADTQDGNWKVDSSSASVKFKPSGDNGHKTVRYPE